MTADDITSKECDSEDSVTLFEILTDFDNLYKAHLSCRKGKRWKDSVACYDLRGFECTLYLQELLKEGKYRLSDYNVFEINERGKKRVIKSVKYHDRVVQKCLMDEIITPMMGPKLISTNSASQKGKGTDYAMKTLKKHLGQQHRCGGGYILICDMKGYFDSIPHELMNEMYAKTIKDEKVMELIRHIHDSIPGGVGVPLGNQLSQMDALLALSPLDHIIKEKLHIKRYGRYMDDFYLIHEDREYLKECRSFIKSYVEERGMRLNEKKTRIVPITQGVDFLGFRYYVTDTGKVIMKLSKRSIKHHKQKLRKMARLLGRGEVTYQACVEAHQGWRAHASRGDTYYLIRRMDNLFKELFEKHKPKEEQDG